MKNIVQTLLIILLGIQVSVADPIDRKKLLQAEIKRSAQLLTTQMQKNQKWVKLKQFKKLNYVIDEYNGKVVSLEMQQALNQKLIAFYLLTDVSFFVFITPGVPIYVPFAEKDKTNMSKITYERIKKTYPPEEDKNKDLKIDYDYFKKLDWQYKLGSKAKEEAKKLIEKIERKIQNQLRSENEAMVYETYQMAQYKIPGQQFALLTFRNEERLRVGLDKKLVYSGFRVSLTACSTPFSLENPCDINDELDKVARKIRILESWTNPQGGVKDRKGEYNTRTTSEGLVKYFSYLSMLKFIEGNEQRYKKKLLPEDIRNAPATTTVAVRGYIETLISNPLKLDYVNNFKAFEEHPIWKLSQSNDPKLQALDEFQYTYYVSDLTKLTRKKYSITSMKI